MAATYSILARDPQTGDVGGAVQSHWFSVGTAVLWGQAGIGMVATQSFTNLSYGSRGLELLRSGLNPVAVVHELTDADEGRDMRQVAVMNANGDAAAFTGERCLVYANHIVDRNCSVQSNMMLRQGVCQAMLEAFQKSSGPLTERLILALEAAEEAGGDIRGRQSAHLLVYRGVSSSRPWEDRLMDLRVDDDPEPLREIRRLWELHQAYQHMDRGDQAMEKGQMDEAWTHYMQAQRLCPGNEEMAFWQGVTLINTGQLADGKQMLQRVFAWNENYKEMARRLLLNKMLTLDKDELERL